MSNRQRLAIYNLTRIKLSCKWALLKIQDLWSSNSIDWSLKKVLVTPCLDQQPKQTWFTLLFHRRISKTSKSIKSQGPTLNTIRPSTSTFQCSKLDIRMSITIIILWKIAFQESNNLWVRHLKTSSCCLLYLKASSVPHQWFTTQ